MDKVNVKRFFDKKAAKWDEMDETQPEIVNIILDNAKISDEVRLLDVACGTGVLIPFYLERGINDITAIDISEEMIKRAKQKFGGEDICFICGDVEETEFDEKFDRIVLYNAFPHFPDPEALIERFSDLLSENGILTIAHGKSREIIDAHHKGEASDVSNGLMSIEELAKILPGGLKELLRISDDKMYQIVAVKEGN